MIPTFDFIQPKSLNDSLVLLGKHQGNARLIAGGTDIIPGFQQEATRFKNIKTLIDIHGLKELKIIERKDDHVMIGAGVTFTELTTHPVIKELFPLLAKAAGSIGSLQVRNRATLAGNFVNNAPCADSVPSLLVYDAAVRIQSPRGKRELALEDFLLKPYKTQLQPDEIVTQIVLPAINENYRGDFYKLGRRRGVAISRISLAVLIDINIKKPVIRDIRIAGGAVTPIGKRFRQLEEFAQGREANPGLFKQLARELGKQILDLTGLRWSSPHKLPVARQMFYQLLESICF
jgi:CO/xanthine dehydrogenase FAD-binding subunit